MIRFGWDLCYTCNYRCPYCCVWENASERDLRLAPPEWAAVWERVYDRCGECYIYISGAEPTTYPGFFELARLLTGKHIVDVCTNFSWPFERIRGIPPQRLRISATYHYPFARFDEFCARAVEARDYLNERQVYYVVDPAEIGELRERSARLRREGLKLVPLPIRRGQELPLSEEHERLIREVSPYSGPRLEYQLKSVSPRGKFCRAGERYAVIRSDGSVDRCSQHAGGTLGNILDAEFRLPETPAPCDREYCPVESQWIVE